MSERFFEGPILNSPYECPTLCIIKCYLQLVSRQDWSFPLSASPFRLIASPPVVALLGLFAIP